MKCSMTVALLLGVSRTKISVHTHDVIYWGQTAPFEYADLSHFKVHSTFYSLIYKSVVLEKIPL